MFLANSKETNQGICSMTSSYIPTNLDAKCKFLPQPYTCGDCARFGSDFACFTVEETDSAADCPGFESKHDDAVEVALYDWYVRGFDVDEKLEKIKEKVKKHEIFSLFDFYKNL